MTRRVKQSDTSIFVNKELRDQLWQGIESKLVEHLFDEEARALIHRAYEFAYQAHDGFLRTNKDRFITHPVAALHMLFEYAEPDMDQIVALLLHDLPSDRGVSLELIEKEFGQEVALLVERMEKLGLLRHRGVAGQVEALQELFLTIADDMRIILLRFVDRLHNIQTIRSLPQEKKERILHETLDIYVPLAEMLGMHKLKVDLQYQCFFELYPDEFQVFLQVLEESIEKEKKYMALVKRQISELLEQHDIHATVSGRVKDPSSTFKKLKALGFATNQLKGIYDIFAIRIITLSEGDCYRALGLIHTEWSPVSGRFKDYIATPKPNGYRSIHTVITGIGQKLKSSPVEIQIRTQDMHDESELGFAAHAAYKQVKLKNKKNVRAQSVFTTYQSLLSDLTLRIRTAHSTTEVREALEGELVERRILVLTPGGDVKELPVGATPIDFAYAIHTEVGNHCYQARADGDIVPLDYELKTGQVVEVITQKQQYPREYWLSFAKTSMAKNRIRAYLLQKNRDEYIRQGRDILNRDLKEYHLKLDEDLTLLKSMAESVEARETLLLRLALGLVKTRSVLDKVVPKAKLEVPEDVPMSEVPPERIVPLFVGSSTSILIAGEAGIPYKLAHCCEPVAGSTIIAYASSTHQFTIHTSRCKILKGLQKKRIYEAKWGA